MLGWSLNLGFAAGRATITPGTIYWLDWQSKGFWPVRLGNALYEPCAILEYDPVGSGDDSEVLLGARDGYVRHYSQRSFTDDGTPFTSRVLVGPFKVGDNPQQEGVIQRIDGVLGSRSGDMNWRLYVGRTAEEVTGEKRASDVTGTFYVAGLNYTARPRVRGSAAALELSNAESDDAWGFEEFTFTSVARGKRRATSR